MLLKLLRLICPWLLEPEEREEPQILIVTLRLFAQEQEPPPTTCRNCRHYHGRQYNGVLLVCGMHPYGDANCNDWEKIEIFEEEIE